MFAYSGVQCVLFSLCVRTTYMYRDGVVLNYLLHHIPNHSHLQVCTAWRRLATDPDMVLRTAKLPDPIDFLSRLSRLHSWYKHLPRSGAGDWFLLYLDTHEEPRYSLPPPNAHTSFSFARSPHILLEEHTRSR